MLYRLSIFVAGFVGSGHALRIRKEAPQAETTTSLVEPYGTLVVQDAAAKEVVKVAKEAAKVIFRSTPEAEMGARTAEYEAKFNNPLAAAKYGFIDDIILPRDTRARLCSELRLLATKDVPRPNRKHGNIPL